MILFISAYCSLLVAGCRKNNLRFFKLQIQIKWKFKSNIAVQFHYMKLSVKVTFSNYTIQKIY